ncbi:MAG: cytochrome c553 [Parasphingorhabdus sp.]|jgi:cytochrome c553
MNLKSFSLLFGVIAGLGWNAMTIASGDAAAGEEKSQPCIACHGVAGKSAIAQFPVLAGQVPGYIASQLAEFKSGVRNDPVMAGMVATLTAEDMADLDAYYSAQDPMQLSISEDQVAEAERGEKVYRGGYRAFEIAACMGCHGPAGHGIPPRFPRVSGQHAAYLEKQLLALKKGTRVSEVMNSIAFRLSEQQIKELALYMSALK